MPSRGLVVGIGAEVAVVFFLELELLQVALSLVAAPFLLDALVLDVASLDHFALVLNLFLQLVEGLPPLFNFVLRRIVRKQI